MSRELWELLVELTREEPTSLTAAECFALLEFFTELLSETDASLDQWAPAFHKCRACVPNCRTELLAILDALIAISSGQT
jgi:hypothetical protein